MKPLTKVLVVDDSAVVRQRLTEILERAPQLTVVGTAADAHIAIRKIKRLQPDVLTLDIEMPGMDGLTFLEKLMRAHPMPVVMISSLTQRGSEQAMRAFQLGAVEVVDKPRHNVGEHLQTESVRIVDAVLAAAHAKRPTPSQDRLAPHPRHNSDVILPEGWNQHKLRGSATLVAIGASTGGTDALPYLLSGLPELMPGIVIVQHMPAMFTKNFAERLNTLSRLEVREAQNGDVIDPGVALVAPGDQHLTIRFEVNRGYVARLEQGPLVSRHRPSVDVLFRAVAGTAGKHAIGVLLTGMGDDGAAGMQEIKTAGGKTLAQDEESCVVYGMPRAAVERGVVDQEVSLQDMSTQLLQVCAHAL
jgi:two-component system chemotaxis response regulator CheB